MMKKSIFLLIICLAAILTPACAARKSGTAVPPDSAMSKAAASQEKPKASGKTKLLGGIAPDEALAYMKRTPNLVIVEVNTPEWKLQEGFTGALYIPYTEMAQRYGEIPKGRPVLIHCGGGIVSKDAYKTLQEKRPDIPELGYIAGVPPVRAYNEWKKTHP